MTTDPDALFHPEPEDTWQYTNLQLPNRRCGFVGRDRFDSFDVSKTGRWLFAHTIVRHDDGRRVCIPLGQWSHS